MMDRELQARLEQARRCFREHYTQVEPDAAFPERVAARLQREPAELLGWAAMRILPIALALAMILAWLSMQSGASSPTTATQEGTDDLLAWVLGESETAP